MWTLSGLKVFAAAIMALSQMSTWKLLNVRTCQYLGDSSGKQLSVLHLPGSRPPQPSPVTGPRWTLLTGRCCAAHSPRQVPLSSAAMLPAWIEWFTSPSPLVRDLNVLFLFCSSLPFFSSSVASEFHYSLSSQCLSASTFIHVNSERQSLTICWECWQQIVS